MKNKIITSLFLGTLLTGSLYAANCDMDNIMQKGNGDKSHCMMKKNKSQNGAHNNRDSSFRMFKELNLTTEQENKIQEIMKEARKNRKNINEAFTKDSFDKSKYISIMNEKRDNMLKSKAEVMEKSYAILTDKQKEQLKVLMDLKQETIY